MEGYCRGGFPLTVLALDAPARRSSPAVWLLLGLLPWPLVAGALYGLHQYVLAMLAYHAVCFAAYACCGSRRPAARTPVAPYLAWAVPFAAATLAAALLVIPFDRMRHVMAGFGYLPWQLPLLAAYFLLVHPFAEEAFWRGTIFARLRENMSAHRAGLISAILFGAWHALVIVPMLPALWWLAVLGVIFFGLGMALVYHRNDGHLLPGTVFHALGGDLPLLLVLLLAFAAPR